MIIRIKYLYKNIILILFNSIKLLIIHLIRQCYYYYLFFIII